MFEFIKKIFDELTESNEAHISNKHKQAHIIAIEEEGKATRIVKHMSKIPYDDGLFSINDFSFTKRVAKKMNSYITDTIVQTCSCKDWKNTRYKYEKDDPRRLCKHLIKQINLENLPKNLIPFKQSIAFYKEERRGFKRRIYSIIKIPDTDLIVLYQQGWIDVFNSEGELYSLVLYDYINEDIKWSGDMHPEGYKKLEEFFQNDDFKLPIPLMNFEIQDIKSYLEIKKPYKILKLKFHDYDIKDTSSRKYKIYIDNEDTIEFSGTAEVSNQFIRLFGLENYADCLFLRNKKEVEIHKSIRSRKREERLQEKEYFRLNYKKTKDMFKLIESPFSLIMFYKLMSQKNWVKKDNGKYIAINNGLMYGKNMDSMVHWEKAKFGELLKQLEDDFIIEKNRKLIAKEALAVKHAEEAKKRSEEDRKLLKKQIKALKRKDINGNILICPACGSYHIHKKDLRQLGYGKIQRYQCQECRRMFKIDVDDSIDIKEL